MGISTDIARPVRLDVSGVGLVGDLAMPPDARSLVIFAHGSGSSRHSPRNRAVAEVLQHGGVGTLLLDLLTEPEELVDATTAEFRFNIPVLADRLVSVVDWALSDPQVSSRPIGLFGASTGAAAALIAAGNRTHAVRAVVSRGGRPDLAEATLERVAAPTLLIVGGRDDVVIALNKEAYARLTCARDMQIVRGATHLFEERGALETVSTLARDWFQKHLH
jgi:putative phosphoribosyl transferase